MRYLCIVHVDPARMAQLSDIEGRELTRECIAYDDKIRSSGNLIASDALTVPETARIVRRRNGKVSITDGPFIETKEFLGGFLYVEAGDFDEAVELAANCPMARMGSIEVRPKLNMGT
jgi:hypothetical protein